MGGALAICLHTHCWNKWSE